MIVAVIIALIIDSYTITINADSSTDVCDPTTLTEKFALDYCNNLLASLQAATDYSHSHNNNDHDIKRLEAIFSERDQVLGQEIIETRKSIKVAHEQRQVLARELVDFWKEMSDRDRLLRSVVNRVQAFMDAHSSDARLKSTEPTWTLEKIINGHK